MRTMAPMRRATLRILMPILLTVSIVGAPTAWGAVSTCAGTGALFAGGSGTTADPYLVANQTHLSAITGDYLACSYAQSASITLTGSWTPIGPDLDPSTELFQGVPFTGEFDGHGYSITGISLNAPAADYVGLFGKVIGASLSDMVLAGDVTGRKYVGGLAGLLEGTAVSEIRSTVAVSGEQSVGGISGYVWEQSSVRDVTVEANLTARSISSPGVFHDLGGVAGYLYKSSITQAQVTGNITVIEANAGGIVGSMSTASVEDAIFTGNITGTDTGLAGAESNYLGGIAGYVETSTLTDVSANSTIKGFEYLGGIAGYFYSSSSVVGATFEGFVIGETWLGGLAGEIYGDGSTFEASDVHVNATITGQDKKVQRYYSSAGGIAGDVYEAVFRDVHFTGGISAAQGQAGGLFGLIVEGVVSGSSSNGTLTSPSGSLGGVAGYADLVTLEKTFSTMDITGTEDLGGLIGYCDDSDLSDVYSRGSVTGTDDVGGLIGDMIGGTSVTRAFATGEVSGTGDVGGLIGSSSASSVTNSFWDLTTSGIATSAGGTASDSVLMKELALFTDAGWSIVEGSDCSSTWGLMSTRNDGYPYLQIFYSRACSSDTSQIPPSWFKSYLRVSPEIECESGWSPSWEQWPHGGTGGFVCNQEIYWNVTRDGWSSR
jgi:hypothetical protein